MADHDYLDSFRNQDGSTSQQGQTNAGLYERQQNYTPAPQQPWESNDAYIQRINSGSSS
jgi:hypothetical protein